MKSVWSGQEVTRSSGGCSPCSARGGRGVPWAVGGGLRALTPSSRGTASLWLPSELAAAPPSGFVDFARAGQACAGCGGAAAAAASAQGGWWEPGSVPGAGGRAVVTPLPPAVNFEALIITLSVLGGSVLLGVAICCCCCCCPRKRSRRPDRSEEKAEREREERRVRQEER